MAFGDILRGLLDERSISQKQLATDLNIAPSTLGNYIQNTREPDFATLKLLANYFDVSIDYLLGYQPHKKVKLTPLELEVLRIFRALTPEHQELFVEQGKLLIRIHTKRLNK